MACGSFNMRADRSLAGRLVCDSCGTPFGVRRQGNNKINIFNLVPLNKKYVFFICLLIVSFILVII